MTIRVLVVDDSPTMRALLVELLNREAGIDVVGQAADANEARAKIKQLDPDVVTLDIEMPGMSGLDFLDKLMRLRPTPVVVVSSLTKEGADTTVRALAAGAVDYYPKPDGSAGALLTQDKGRLGELVRCAASSRHRSRPSPALAASMGVSQQSDREEARRRPPQIIAIGSSTGGIEALQTVLGQFPEDCPPTVIVQHINAQFAGAVARRLDGCCPPKVQLAETDTPLKRGNVYIAPGNDHHLQVRASGMFYAKLRTGDLVTGHRPSVDMLFHSVAEAAGSLAVGILLTGMGSDGAQGLLALRNAGAWTIAQDAASCTVFGMPRAAIELGAASRVLPLNEIAGGVLANMVAA